MQAVQAVPCLPWTTRLRGAWTPAAQLLLAAWSGVPGFAAASMLLLVRRPVRRVLFTLVVAGAAVLAGVTGRRTARATPSPRA
ncbi:hypothetical protein [Kitasatospora griseola]|uniref:hypothetical protein n=1 Tax=Kitasatospora griseola TaxID=2064 RepID=UPI00342268AB